MKPPIEIIPAIDLLDGKCVRLRQGDYAQCTYYATSPEQMAQRFYEQGYKRLHVVDLEGARGKATCPETYALLRRIKRKTPLLIELGGGLKTVDSLTKAFDAGADRVICGSVAVSHPESLEAWLRLFGGHRLVWGADLKDGKLSVKGWQEAAQITMESLMARFTAAGLHTIICTQVACDGMMQGPDIVLYTQLMRQYPAVQVIASGGVRGRQDIQALEAAGVPAVVVGKAFYEGGTDLC